MRLLLMPEVDVALHRLSMACRLRGCKNAAIRWHQQIRTAICTAQASSLGGWCAVMLCAWQCCCILVALSTLKQQVSPEISLCLCCLGKLRILRSFCLGLILLNYEPVLSIVHCI